MGRLILSLVAAAVAVGCQPPQPTRSITVALEAEHFTGSSGVRVFTVPDPGAEFLTFHVRYRTGGVDDPAGKEGLAHLVEHLMFTRTISLGDRDLTIGSRIDEISLAHNAVTRADITHYYTVVPKEHLSEMFAIETVRITGGCQGLSEEQFAREKEVVRNEIRWRLSGDMGKIYPAFLKAFYGDHPYARPVGGNDVSLQAITLADVCEFMKNNYAPSKATFYVVGNVTNADVRASAVKWLGRIPPREVPAPKEIGRAELKKGRQTITLDVEAPYLIAGWRIPMESEAYPLIDEAMGALSDRMSSFAFTYELGSGVSVETFGGAKAPIAVLATELRSTSKIDEGIDSIKKAGDDVEFSMPREAYNPGERDMFDAHSDATESLLAKFETPMNRGISFADLDDRSGGTRFLVEEVAAIYKISSGELRSMASDTFDFDNAAVLVVKPSGKVVAGQGSGTSIAHSSNQWKVPVDPSLANAAHPLPELGSRNVVVADYKLGSGMRVILAEDGDLPLVRAYLTFEVGSSAEPDNKPGLASVAGRYQGGSVTNDHTAYGRRDLKTRIDYMVEQFAYGKRGVAYDQQSLEKARATLRQTFSQPSVVARVDYERDMAASLYGKKHPYATRGHPTLGDFGKINRDDLISFGRSYYGGASGTLIISGQYDIGLMKQYIEKKFDHWEKRKRPEPPPDVDPASSIHGIVTAVDPGATQLTVELNYPSPRGIDKHYPARLVLAAIVGGRLRALREERGLSYGATASFDPALGPGRWIFSAEVDPSRAAEGAGAIVTALEALRRGAADGQFLIDFVLARRSVVNELLLGRSLPSATLGQLAFASRYGLPLNYQFELATIVATVTPDQVRALLASELAAKREVIGLLGSASAVAEGKRGALSPPVVEPAAPAPAPASEAPEVSP